MLSGCSHLPEVSTNFDSQNDELLCENLGIAFASKDTEALSLILKEGERRGLENNETCVVFAKIGARKYKDAENEPSGFETVISTLDAIQSIGNTQNHNITIN